MRAVSTYRIERSENSKTTPFNNLRGTSPNTRVTISGSSKQPPTPTANIKPTPVSGGAPSKSSPMPGSKSTPRASIRPMFPVTPQPGPPSGLPAPVRSALPPCPQSSTFSLLVLCWAWDPNPHRGCLQFRSGFGTSL
uniref:vegetative cell wall protein gp1-like n=1 Tax=Oncorhynchus gorbuscha TaxID=8017 RepID=UPI001EAF3A79|nr:vegetative cell wall protein gp1-like [Oncorhynchus gorbuscha]XP_046176830.1 vegetative cell wall protein gp1-like [Oncorhynchus gorbuscha]